MDFITWRQNIFVYLNHGQIEKHVLPGLCSTIPFSLSNHSETSIVPWYERVASMPNQRASSYRLLISLVIFLFLFPFQRCPVKDHFIPCIVINFHVNSTNPSFLSFFLCIDCTFAILSVGIVLLKSSSLWALWWTGNTHSWIPWFSVTAGIPC